MEFTAGGGIMLAIGAALWLAYLMPNWFKRREYLATERNAVRMQQAIRVMAETADMPDAVRADLEAQAKPIPPKQEKPAKVREPRASREPRVLTAAQRLRRTRLAGTGALAAAVVTAIVQTVVLAATGVGAATGLVFAASVLVGGGALVLLYQVNSVARSRAAVQVAPVVSEPVRRRVVLSEPLTEEQRQWTPVPVPKPLYLSKPTTVIPPISEIASKLAAERAEAERAQRATIPSIAPQQPKKPSRFASMGMVDEADAASPDLDAVLARRRSVG